MYCIDALIHAHLGTEACSHLYRMDCTWGSYRGTSLIRNSPHPQGHHRALGIVLLYGPRGALFLMSEVPLMPTVLREGFRESRRCSRDTYPESYITKYILIYEE